MTTAASGPRGDAPGAVTRDTLLGGAITLLQPARGYRVNIDAVLLAAFAATGRHAQRVVDLGAGVGAVSLVLAHLGAVAHVDLVERDATLGVLARRNLELCGLPGAVHELELGAGRLPVALAGADLVVANPPFFDAEATRPARHPGVRAARSGALAPFVCAAQQLMEGPRTRAAFAYPARSLATLLEVASREGLVAKRLRLVHADPESPARLALVELRRARPGGLVVEAPLFEWAAPGVRSTELSALVGGKRLSPAVDRT